MGKLREADAMLAAGRPIAAVVQALGVSEPTYHRGGTSTAGCGDPYDALGPDVAQPEGEPANRTRGNVPLHTVCAWIGNTKAIAAGHYLQVTDADTRATGSAEAAANPATQTATNPAKQTATNPATHARPRDGTRAQKIAESLENQVFLVTAGAGCDPMENQPMGISRAENAGLDFAVADLLESVARLLRRGAADACPVPVPVPVPVREAV